jgi:beta-N-acetylhexosaminidase
MTDEERLRRQVGQLMVFGFYGFTVPDTAAALIRDQHVGNLLLFSRNARDRRQVARLTARLQEMAREDGQTLPLTISADQENGTVSRLPADVPGLPGSMAIGATWRPDNAYDAGAMTGRLLQHLGINWDLAPVLDINNQAHNPVIGVRAFGDDARAVAAFGTAFARGLQARGIIATGKHFPGHGDTDVDSHRGLPVIAHDRARMAERELVPFLAAINGGIDVIMTAHIVFPAVEPDGIPATLSRRVITDLLRGELGFDGVVTTDCLEMDAIAKTVGVERGAVLALRAGADLIMVSHRRDRQLAAIEAVVRAVREGELSERRIDEAASRVRRLKETRLFAPPPESWPSTARAARRLQARLAEAAVTRLRWEGQLPEVPRRLAVLRGPADPALQARAAPEDAHPLADALGDLRPDAHVQQFGFPEVVSNAGATALLHALRSYDMVLAGITGGSPTPYLDFVNSLPAAGVPLVALLLQSPYDARLLGHVPRLLALYEPTPFMVRAAVASLFDGPAYGRLPVTISPGWPRGFKAWSPSVEEGARDPFVRVVARYLRQTIQQGRDAVRIGPFLVGFDTMSESPYVNYAVPDDGAEPTPGDVGGLVKAFTDRGLRPRLEYIREAAPAVEAALGQAGFVPEGLHPVMAITRTSFRESDPPSGFRIRASSDDRDFWEVRRVQNAAFGDGDPDAVDILHLHALLRQGGISLLVETEAGEVVGGGDVTPPRSGTAEVAGIAVREDCRGRGIGQALTSALVRAAFRNGVRRVWLTPVGSAEERLYTRIGFVACGSQLQISKTV